ncbi:MAG: hypothetical protein R3D62_04385 [Xanthobacteraceae bacterium]
MSSLRLVFLTSVAALACSPGLQAAPLPPEQPLPVAGAASAALSGKPVMPIRTAQSKKAPAPGAEDDQDDEDQNADDQGQDPDEDDEGDEDQDQGQNPPKHKD